MNYTQVVVRTSSTPEWITAIASVGTFAIAAKVAYELGKKSGELQNTVDQVKAMAETARKPLKALSSAKSIFKKGK